MDPDLADYLNSVHDIRRFMTDQDDMALSRVRHRNPAGHHPFVARIAPASPE